MVDLSKFEDELMFSPLQKELLAILEKRGPQTRSDLVRQVRSPRSTVYDNLDRLMLSNLVRKFSRPTNSRGRPLVYFKITA